MIAYVKGKLSYILDEAVIVEVNGVGYEIICGNPYRYQSSLEQEVMIFTYQHVREDAITLFGFKSEEEKYLFTKLISVSGIGPKSAIAILSGADPSEFVNAVEQENEKFLTQFPGVGKKTARQIILDLKGKLSSVFSLQLEAGTANGLVERHVESLSMQEAEEALLALGYSSKEVQQIRPELLKMENAGTDELIKRALSLFVKN